MAINLEKMQQNLDSFLKRETPGSFNKWINQHRNKKMKIELRRTYYYAELIAKTDDATIKEDITSYKGKSNHNFVDNSYIEQMVQVIKDIAIFNKMSDEELLRDMIVAFNVLESKEELIEFINEVSVGKLI